MKFLIFGILDLFQELSSWLEILYSYGIFCATFISAETRKLGLKRNFVGSLKTTLKSVVKVNCAETR